MRTALLSILSALAANLLFVWWGRTTFVPLGLVVVGGWLLAILLAVLGAVIYGFSRKAITDQTRLVLRSLVVSIVFFSSTLFGLPLVHRSIAREVAVAQKTVENLAVRLSARYATTGAYPAKLDEMASRESLPRLLARPDAYHSTGTSYTFRVRIPGNPEASEVYRSQDQRWRSE